MGVEMGVGVFDFGVGFLAFRSDMKADRASVCFVGASFDIAIGFKGFDEAGDVGLITQETVCEIAEGETGGGFDMV